MCHQEAALNILSTFQITTINVANIVSTTITVFLLFELTNYKLKISKFATIRAVTLQKDKIIVRIPNILL